MRRKHGFQAPLDPHQVSASSTARGALQGFGLRCENSPMYRSVFSNSYYGPSQVGAFVLFFFLVAGCYVLFMPFVINVSARWGLVAAYSILVCFIIVTNYWTR